MNTIDPKKVKHYFACPQPTIAVEVGLFDVWETENGAHPQVGDYMILQPNSQAVCISKTHFEKIMIPADQWIENMITTTMMEIHSIRCEFNFDLVDYDELSDAQLETLRDQACAILSGLKSFIGFTIDRSHSVKEKKNALI